MYTTNQNLPYITIRLISAALSGLIMPISENSVMAFQRKSDKKEDLLIVILQLYTWKPVNTIASGFPIEGGNGKRVFNTDNLKYGGSGVLNIRVTSVTALQ
jgi:1,4-alpha-glucan branching enzyme